MKYFIPLLYMCVSVVGISPSVNDLSNGTGVWWLDGPLVLLHAWAFSHWSKQIDRRANTPV